MNIYFYTQIKYYNFEKSFINLFIRAHTEGIEFSL